mgnify:FL=1
MESAWWEPFLTAYAACGNARAGCEAANINPNVLYDARDNHPEFEAAYHLAHRAFMDRIEGTHGERALDEKGMPGVIGRLSILKAYRPHLYKDNIQPQQPQATTTVNQLNVILDSPEGRKLAERLAIQLARAAQGQGKTPALPVP